MTNYPDNYVAVEIGHTVKLRVGLSTYLFTPDDYAAIADAIFSNPPEDVVWQGRVTSELVSGMTGDQIDEMVRSLDESVELTLDDYALEDLDRCRLQCVCTPEEKAK